MKDLIKRLNSKPMNKNTETQNFYRPGYELKVKKQLNFGGKIIIASVYTFAIIFSTLKFKEEKKVRISWEDREIIKRELLKDIETKRSIASVAPKVLPKEVRIIEKIYIPEVQSAKHIEKQVNHENPEIIKYTKVNSKILKFKMHQKYKRLKEKLNTKREILLSTLNLTNPDDRIKLQDFDDNMKLELYTLRSNNYEAREQFEKNQFMAKN